MRSDAGLMGHRMAHQTTDPAIPIRKWVNVIQTMMGRWDGHDSASGPERREVIALLKIPHEVRHMLTGGRQVATDRVIVFGHRTPLTRCHDNFPRLVLKGEHCRGSVSIKLMVNPLDEFRRCRRRQCPVKK